MSEDLAYRHYLPNEYYQKPVKYVSTVAFTPGLLQNGSRLHLILFESKRNNFAINVDG